MLFLCFILLQNGFWPIRTRARSYLYYTNDLFTIFCISTWATYSNWLSSELKFIKQFLLFEKAFYYLFTLEVSTCFFVAFASTSSLLRTSLLLLHMWYAFITGPYTPYVGLTPYSQPTKSNYKRSPTPFLLAMSIDRLTDDN